MKINIKNRISFKWILILTLFLVVLVPLTAYAAPPTVAGQAGDVLNNFLTSLSNFLVNILRLLQKILWPIFLAIGGLLNNDLLFGAGMEERLLKIWGEIRNFVNIAFVVILLGVALYNVLGFAADNYQLKTWLPKFAIALIAVNFSFLAVKLVLDVTNVLTVAIFALPSSISDDLSYSEIVPKGVEPDLTKKLEIIDSGKEGEFTGEYAKKMEKLCVNYYGDVDTFNKKIIKKEIQPSSLLCNVRSGSKKYVFTNQGVQFFKRYSSRNAALILAIQMMNVIDIDEVSKNAESGKINLSSIAYNLLFSVILYVVYGTAYIAMFLVLLVRLVVLWILIVLSPLIALKPLIPGGSDQTGELQTQFVQNAIAPIMMAIPITLGYMMLDALKQYKPASTATFKGAEALQTLSSGVNMELSGIADLQALIIAFAAVAVVWIGVFKAAEKTAAAGITGRFKEIVTQGAKTVGGLWKFIPVIPSAAGAGGKISFAQARQAALNPLKQFQQRYGTVDQGITKEKISSIARSQDIGQARQALEQGLSKPHLQRPLLNLLEDWKKKQGTKRGAFATRVLNTLSKEEIAKMRQGKLGLASQNALRRTADRVGPPLPKTQPTGYRRPPVAGRGRTQGTVAANDNALMINDIDKNPALAAAAGANKGKLQKLLADRNKAYLAGKSTDQIDAQIAAVPSIKTMKAVYANKPTIGGVTAAATAFKAPESVATGKTDDLKKAVNTANLALRKAGLGKTERKDILKKVIGDAVGNHEKTQALLDKVL